jgi:hypothetical protein
MFLFIHRLLRVLHSILATRLVLDVRRSAAKPTTLSGTTHRIRMVKVNGPMIFASPPGSEHLGGISETEILEVLD